jgi:S-DNA-T family DNA segregation ATPase FtsK/SpoIIIE
MRYSPSELRLYLIDGKDGVEFLPYRDLPHAEVVSLRSSPQLSRSVLTELIAEKERRNAAFKNSGVTDITKYRQIGKTMPRILLLVDEYQELFDGDVDGQASSMLLQLAQQGRNAGIHMLLASQRFGAAGMLNQTAIFGNIHLRMAMQMTQSDIQALTEFGRRGKQLISNCDLPGKIVVNDRSGDDNSNVLGKVAYLKTEERQQLIANLVQKAQREIPNKDIPVTIVFDGSSQPNFVDNPYIAYLMHQPQRLSAQEFEKLARRPVHEEGLAIIDWFAAERPHVMWLGQEYNVRGQAAVVLRRRINENIIVLGGNNAVRYGMLGALLTSIVLTTSPSEVEFVIMDRSIPNTDWNKTLSQVTETVLKPNNYSISLYKESKEIDNLLTYLADIVKQRRETLSESEMLMAPAILCILTELDRIDEIRRPSDSYGMAGSPLGDKLQRLCIEGPAVGVHIILSFSGVRPMTHVIDERRTLPNFRHRIATQISEDESLTLVRSRKASQLQLDGPTPISGLYMDVENDSAVKFKPYTIEATIPFEQQLNEISQRLLQWRH